MGQITFPLCSEHVSGLGSEIRNSKLVTVIQVPRYHLTTGHIFPKLRHSENPSLDRYNLSDGISAPKASPAGYTCIPTQILQQNLEILTVAIAN